MVLHQRRNNLNYTYSSRLRVAPNFREMINPTNSKTVVPEIVPFAFGDIYEGESSQVLCVLSKGDDPVRLEWFHGAEPLTSSDDVTIMPTGPRGSLLAFQSLSPVHFGNYTCRATNKAGVTSFTAPLVING